MNDPYVEEPISKLSGHENDIDLRSLKFSNQNGGNFIISKHEHKILPIFSRKYTLDQSTAQQGTPEVGKPNAKCNEINSKENVISSSPLPRRGILKNHFSEPGDGASESVKPLPRHWNSDGDLVNNRSKYRLHFPHFKRKTEDSSQEFINPAFEPDDTVPKDLRLRDLVAQVLKQKNDEFLHPYGQTSLYTSVFVGSKTLTETEGTKLAFWGILLFIILGITGGIIFMAEMHKLEVSDTNSTISR